MVSRQNRWSSYSVTVLPGQCWYVAPTSNSSYVRPNCMAASCRRPADRSTGCVVAFLTGTAAGPPDPRRRCRTCRRPAPRARRRGVRSTEGPAQPPAVRRCSFCVAPPCTSDPWAFSCNGASSRTPLALAFLRSRASRILALRSSLADAMGASGSRGASASLSWLMPPPCHPTGRAVGRVVLDLPAAVPVAGQARLTLRGRTALAVAQSRGGLASGIGDRDRDHGRAEGADLGPGVAHLGGVEAHRDDRVGAAVAGLLDHPAHHLVARV